MHLGMDNGRLPDIRRIATRRRLNSSWLLGDCGLSRWIARRLRENLLQQVIQTDVVGLTNDKGTLEGKNYDQREHEEPHCAVFTNETLMSY